MNLKLKVLASVLSLAFASSVFAADEPKKDAEPAPDWTWTGHVDLNSAYYLRGITNTYGNNKWSPPNAVAANRAGDAPESRNPALSWGLDFTHSSGFYVGYWASQLTYSYDSVGKSYDYYKQGVLGVAPNPSANPNFYVTNNSIENDLYGGYTGKIGELGYNIGLTYYIYAPGKYSNAPETKVALTYGEFGATSQTLLDDTIWGNKGDTYWTATWTKALPYDLTFTANVGGYTYTKEGKFLGSKDTALNVPCAANSYFFVNGCYASVDLNSKPISGGFRHVILGISQPIGSTGLTWNAQAIISGVNRFNVQQDNKVTAGISYAF
jgi:hypothetical protein